VTLALIERGASLSAKTKNGLTALHMATQGDHTDCLELLLTSGADIDDVSIVCVIIIIVIIQTLKAQINRRKCHKCATQTFQIA